MHMQGKLSNRFSTRNVQAQTMALTHSAEINRDRGSPNISLQCNNTLRYILCIIKCLYSVQSLLESLNCWTDDHHC